MNREMEQMFAKDAARRERRPEAAAPARSQGTRSPDRGLVGTRLRSPILARGFRITWPLQRAHRTGSSARENRPATERTFVTISLTRTIVSCPLSRRPRLIA
jgi:hypothetical protein